MSEHVLRRLTWCPSGKPSDEKILELVLQLDDPLPIKDRTPRRVNVTRIYSRGDLAVLLAHGLRSVGYTVNAVSVVTVSTRHVEADLALAGLFVDLWTYEHPKRPGIILGMLERWAGGEGG